MLLAGRADVWQVCIWRNRRAHAHVNGVSASALALACAVQWVKTTRVRRSSPRVEGHTRWVRVRRGYRCCRHMWREEGGEDMMACGGTYEVRARRGHRRRRRMWRGEARHRHRPSGVWREGVGEDVTRARARPHRRMWRYGQGGQGRCDFVVASLLG